MNTLGTNEVEGKAVIVTGAASGIGRAIAELLHARGAFVIAEDINPAVKDLTREGMVPFVADITQDGVAESAVELAISRFGKLDVLVNNAGRILYKNIVEMTRKDWEWQMETNVTGAFLHSREAMKAPNATGGTGYDDCFPFDLVGSERVHIVFLFSM